MRKIQEFYKPTDNPTLKNFHFRALIQQDQESFPAFCNRVEKEARHCRFNCDNENCSAEKIATNVAKPDTLLKSVRALKISDKWSQRTRGKMMGYTTLIYLESRLQQDQSNQGCHQACEIKMISKRSW